MNVYDFDKTIYKGNSSAHFYLFLLARYPAMLLYAPLQIWYGIKYLLGIVNKTEAKEKLFCSFKAVKNMDKALTQFWIKHRKNIKAWYLKQQTPHDIVISASPHFLLEPVCRELGIKTLIASNIDKKTGMYKGVNCHGPEKVNRLKEVMPSYTIERFYSDSLSDAPLARLAKKSYLVKGERLLPWYEKAG